MPALRSAFRGLSHYFIAATLFVGAVTVFIGWWSGIAVLKSLVPGYPEMTPGAAGSFILIGLAVIAQNSRRRNLKWLVPAVGCILSAAGVLVLGAFALDFSGPVLSILLPVQERGGTSLGGSPISALNFLLIGICLILNRRPRFSQLCGGLTALVLVTAYAAVLGHIYKANTLYGFSGINAMPLNAAFLFIVAGVALFLRNRKFRLMELLTSDSLGGASARRLIPVVIVAPALIDWFRLLGQHQGLYDSGFGTAAAVFIQVALLLTVVIFSSGKMHRSDMTRRRAETELADKEMRYRELFDYSQGLICIHDLDGRLSTLNPAALDLLGYSESEIIGRNLREFVPDERQPDFDAYLREVTYEGLAKGLLELESKAGNRVVLRFNNVLATEEGKEPYVLGHAQDVTELVEAQRQLRNLSLTDDLTGLYNRRGLRTLGEQQMRLESHSGTARGLAILFADMDGLKTINDTYGHEAGSDAIKTLARLMKNAVRGGDIVARWGGDEFVILSIGALGEDSGLMVERIYTRLNEYNAASLDPYPIECSIGVTPIGPKDSRTFDEIVADADAAMYLEKSRRKRACPNDAATAVPAALAERSGGSSPGSDQPALRA